MIDITDDMLRFKEAIRHVWNTYLLDADSPMSPVLQQSFARIELELLRALVLLPLEMPHVADGYRRRPMPIFVQAKAELSEIPVQFGSIDANGNMRWELPCTVSAAEISEYQFIEFFDWNPYAHVDMSYVKAQSSESGRLALIEQTHCCFALGATGKS